MDDNRFDREIREKLGEYEAPGFDPSALAALHHQMAAITITPWYSTYRTELMVGSTVLLAALLIIWSQWTFTNRSTSALEAEILSLKNQAENVSQLQELEYLRGMKPDTIRIVEYQEQTSTVYLSLLRKIEHLETALRTMLEESTRQNELLLAQVNTNPLPEELFSSNYSNSFIPISTRVTPHQRADESKRAIATELSISPESPQRNLSAKTIKDIQKHYQKGIGIRVGPAATFGRGSYSVGNGRYDFGIGILADFITSPSLSVETGIIHSVRHNRIPGSDISQPNTFPGADPSLGELTNIDIDSWVFETPVNLKYRYPISMKSNWFGSIGYTNMFYSKQVLEYDYRFEANPFASVNSAVIDKNLKVYPGTLNISLGFSSELKKKRILEASVYYRYGLGKVGIEQTTPEFIGIRGAYWFTLK